MNLDDIHLDSSGGPTKKLSRTSRTRVLKTVDLIRKGHSRTRIIEVLQEEDHIAEKVAARYYKAAQDYLLPTEEEQGELRMSIIATLQELIADGIGKKDKTATVKALDLLAKISGNMTQKIEANVNSDISISFNIEGEGEDNEQDN